MTKKESALQKLKEETGDIVLQAKSVSVRSDKGYEAAAEFLLGVKKLGTQIEDHHEPMRVKTYEAYQEVLKARKRLLAPVKEAETILKRAMSVFLSKRIEKQAKIEERIKEGGRGQITEAPKPTGVATRLVWRWEVTDPDKIDRNFLMVDESAISTVVTALGNEAPESVGGIRVWQEPQIAASRG